MPFGSCTGLYFFTVPEEPDRPARAGDKPCIGHFFELPHHGAPVQAQIFRQRAVRDGDCEHGAALLRAQKIEIGRQLQPDGRLREDIDPVGLKLRLARRELEQVAHQLAVVGARVGAPLDDVLIVDKQNAARLARAHIVLLHIAGEQKDLPKYAVAKQLLHHALIPVRVTVVQAGVAAHQHAQLLRAAGIGHDDLPRVKAHLTGAETHVHRRPALRGDPGKNRQFLQKNHIFSPRPMGRKHWLYSGCILNQTQDMLLLYLITVAYATVGSDGL